jgi:hypothetical protein
MVKIMRNLRDLSLGAWIGVIMLVAAAALLLLILTSVL